MAEWRTREDGRRFAFGKSDSEITKAVREDIEDRTVTVRCNVTGNYMTCTRDKIKCKYCNTDAPGHLTYYIGDEKFSLNK